MVPPPFSAPSPSSSFVGEAIKDFKYLFCNAVASADEGGLRGSDYYYGNNNNINYDDCKNKTDNNIDNDDDKNVADDDGNHIYLDIITIA